MRYTTSSQVESAVRKLYQKNGYVVLSEVRNGTGYARRARTADMLIVSTWPSRGLHVEGVEIKVNRQDLYRELGDGEKADEIAKYCTFWWLAVPDDLITPEMMIPDGWGVIAVDDKGKAAVVRRGKELAPVPMDTLFTCAVLRNVAENYVPATEVKEQIKIGLEQKLKERKADFDYRGKEMERAIREFREVTGVNLMDDKRDHPIWGIKDAGEAVKLLMEMRQTPAEELREAAERLRGAAAAVEQAMKLVGCQVETA